MREHRAVWAGGGGDITETATSTGSRPDVRSSADVAYATLYCGACCTARWLAPFPPCPRLLLTVSPFSD